MPQQQPGQFDFNPQAVQGPFSQMLSGQSSYGQQQPPSGWSTKTGSVLNVVTNFLSGMEKGRVKNYERQEQQRAKERELALDYANMKLRDPNLTDDARKKIEDQTQQFLAKSILGDSQGKGKGKTDQPEGIMGHVAGAFKDIALGMVGGKMPAKGEKQDPTAFMVQVDQVLQQPGANKQTIANAAQQKVQEALQKLPPGSTREDAMRTIQPFLPTLQKNMPGDQYNSFIDSIASGYSPGMKPGEGAKQFVTLVSKDDPTKEETAIIGPNNELYHPGTTQKYTPEELAKFVVHPSSWQPRQQAEGVVKIDDPSKPGSYILIPRSEKDKWTGKSVTAGGARGGVHLLPTNVNGMRAPRSVTTDALDQPIDRSGQTDYKIDAATGKWYPNDAPVAKPPTPEDLPKERNAALKQIEMDRIKNQNEIQRWYSNAVKAIQSKNSDALTQLGVPANSGADWAQAEFQRRLLEERRSFGEAVNTINSIYAAPPPKPGQAPAEGRGEAPPPTRSGSAAAPPADSFKGYIGDFVHE